MRVDAENGVNAEGAFTKEHKCSIVVCSHELYWSYLYQISIGVTLRCSDARQPVLNGSWILPLFFMYCKFLIRILERNSQGNGVTMLRKLLWFMSVLVLKHSSLTHFFYPYAWLCLYTVISVSQMCFDLPCNNNSITYGQRRKIFHVWNICMYSDLFDIMKIFSLTFHPFYFISYISLILHRFWIVFPNTWTAESLSRCAVRNAGILFFVIALSYRTYSADNSHII